MIEFILGACWLASVLIAWTISFKKGYKKGDWDVHTRLVTVAVRGDGVYTVTSPSEIIVYKLHSVTKKVL